MRSSARACRSPRSRRRRGPSASIRITAGWWSDPEAAGETSLRVADRRPRPPVALQEGARCRLRVSRVETEEAIAAALLLHPTCVGTRLALAGASPGRPDVDEYRLAAELCQRGGAARDGGPGDRRSRRTACRHASRRERERERAGDETIPGSSIRLDCIWTATVPDYRFLTGGSSVRVRPHRRRR